jgi:type I restriction enzyme S subunit
MENGLPVGWQRKRLDQIADFLDGQRKPIKEGDRQSIQGEYPYYGASGIIDYVNDYLFDDELILLGEDGANIVNRSSPLAFRVSGKCWVNNHAHVIKPKPGTEIDFLVEYLESLDYSGLNSGTAQPKLNLASCQSIPVLVPPFEEQKGIAAVLSTWDRGIRQLTDLIAAKLRFKQGLMQQLLTGKRRFPGFREEWKHVRIGDVAREVSERNPDGDSIPVLSCTKYDGLVDSLEYFGKRVFSENTDNYKVVRRNDFAYATNHIEEGSIGLLRHAEAGLVSPMYTVFRTNGDVNPDYLYRVLKTETLRQVFASFTSASVNRRGSLRWKQFSTIPLELPGVEEQSYINNVMAAFDLEVALLRKKLDAFKQQKKGLMRKLLTGQVQV